MSDGPVGLAIVGAGVISGEYLRNLAAFPDVQVLAIADLDFHRAGAVAAEHGVPVGGDVETALAHDGVELIVNLTVPAAHASVSLQALRAGKHVYSEKPLALDCDGGERLLGEAARRGLRIGAAPDTFLGAGIQSAARAIEAGLIGRPVAASATAMGPGPERWHPRPEFLFQPGGGPLLDLGPYHLTALVTLFGPVTRVSASAHQGRAERVIGSGPRAGTAFPVTVPTHVMALASFADNTDAVVNFSFESAVRRAGIEILGTEGTLALGDPIFFDGPLRVRAAADDAWRELPMTGTSAGRGIGVLDMARAVRAHRPHRAAGELAHHVLDAMTAIAEAAEQGAVRPVHSRCDRPPGLAPGWDPYSPTLA